jgi:hypothetical protein
MTSIIRTLVVFLLLFLGVESCFAQVAVPVSCSAVGQGDTILVSVGVDDVTGQNVLSYEFVLKYDAAVLHPLEIIDAGTLGESKGWSVLSQQGVSSLRVGSYGAAPLIGAGVLFSVKCQVVGSVGMATDLILDSFLFNNGSPGSNVVNGRYQVPGLPPLSPILVQPFDLASISSYQVELSWQFDEGASGYRIQVATDSLFHSLVIDDSSLVGTSMYAGPLGLGQKYFWRVQARNPMGRSDWSVIRGFSVYITSVEWSGGSPNSFKLDQNYPNPFNPSTTITYALPHREEVSLAIFDLLGEKIADLVQGTVEAGIHEVPFYGSSLASGMYIYRMQAGSFVSEKKLIILK